MYNWFPFLYLSSISRNRRGAVAQSAVPLIMASGSNTMAGAFGTMAVDQISQRSASRETQLASETVSILESKGVRLTQAELSGAPTLYGVLQQHPDLLARILAEPKATRNGPLPAGDISRAVAELRQDVDDKFSTVLTEIKNLKPAGAPKG